MQIRSDCDEGCLRCRLTGELDHHAAAYTMRELDRQIDRYLPRCCILDMSELTFMDSSGIAIVLRVHKRMRELGGRTRVENPAAQPLRVLDASGIDRFVKIMTTVQEGIR